MASQNFELQAEIRNDLGKGASRRLRRQNRIPAVVYGGEGEPQSISVAANEIAKATLNDAFYSQLIGLEINDGGKGQSDRVIVRDMQRHPAKGYVTHIDFLRAAKGVELQMNIPLHFLNEEECVGVKGGGQISHLEIELAVSCLPRNIPEAIEVDMLNLDVGDTVRISDIELPEGVTSVDLSQPEPNDRALASVHAMRVSSEPEEEDVEAGDEAEGDDEAAAEDE